MRIAYHSSLQPSACVSFLLIENEIKTALLRHFGPISKGAPFRVMSLTARAHNSTRSAHEEEERREGEGGRRAVSVPYVVVESFPFLQGVVGLSTSVAAVALPAPPASSSSSSSSSLSSSSSCQLSPLFASSFALLSTPSSYGRPASPSPHAALSVKMLSKPLPRSLVMQYVKTSVQTGEIHRDINREVLVSARTLRRIGVFQAHLVSFHSSICHVYDPSLLTPYETRRELRSPLRLRPISLPQHVLPVCTAHQVRCTCKCTYIVHAIHSRSLSVCEGCRSGYRPCLVSSCCSS